MSRSTEATRRLAIALVAVSLPIPWPSDRALAASSALPRADHSLLTVESPDGGFRVQLPDALPPPARKSRSTVLGDVHEAHYVLAWGRARVSVELYEIPELAALIFPSRLLLDQAVSGLISDMEAREIERRPLRRQEHPARLVTYELPGDPGTLERALVVLASSRLYVVAVTAPPGAALGPGLERIIESFEVIGADPPGLRAR
jgi:hypothetical protein